MALPTLAESVEEHLAVVIGDHVEDLLDPILDIDETDTHAVYDDPVGGENGEALVHVGEVQHGIVERLIPVHLTGQRSLPVPVCL
jgi:hypothetical protein